MDFQDLVKELDPDYHYCYYCGRLLHISILRRGTVFTTKRPFFLCRDEKNCHQSKEYCERQRNRKRNRS